MSPREDDRTTARGRGRTARSRVLPWLVLGAVTLVGCGTDDRAASTTTPATATEPATTATTSKVPGEAGPDVVRDGTGNQVLDVTNPSGPGAPYVLRVVNRGPGRFVSVEGLTSEGTAAGYATKASGTDGVQVFDSFDPSTSRYGTTARLKVEAATPDTAWEVRLVALRNVPTWDPATPLTGTGDTVVQIPTGTPSALDVTTTVSPADRPLLWTFYRPGPRGYLDKAGDASDAGQTVVPTDTILLSVQGSMGQPYDWSLTPAG